MTHTTTQRQRNRILALVLGMKELAYAVGIGECGEAIEIRTWRTMGLQRLADSRITFVCQWLQGIIQTGPIDHVILVKPLDHHLKQAKNTIKLGHLLDEVISVFDNTHCNLTILDRSIIAAKRGKPNLPDHAPHAPKRARWALAALYNEGSINEK